MIVPLQTAEGGEAISRPIRRLRRRAKYALLQKWDTENVD
jgi:hypothetical protein